jgi:hypothetical protein
MNTKARGKFATNTQGAGFFPPKGSPPGSLLGALRLEKFIKILLKINMTPGYYAKRAYVRGVRGGVSDLYGHLSLCLDRLTATKRHGF